MGLNSLPRMNPPLPVCLGPVSKRILTQSQGVCLLQYRDKSPAKTLQAGGLRHSGDRHGSLVPASLSPHPCGSSCTQALLGSQLQERTVDMPSTHLSPRGVVLRKLSCSWEGHQSAFFLLRHSCDAVHCFPEHMGEVLIPWSL